jgi:hypothetical protein
MPVALQRARHVVLTTGATGEVAETILVVARKAGRLIYATHPERGPKQARASRAAHPERSKEVRHKWNKTEKAKASKAAYWARPENAQRQRERERERSRIRRQEPERQAYHAAYRETHREQQAEWERSHRAERTTYHRERLARKRAEAGQ